MPLTIDRDLLARVAARASGPEGSAEIFLEHRQDARARFEEGRLLHPSCGARFGAGIRAFRAGHPAGFLHLDGVTDERLLRSASRLREGNGAAEPAGSGRPVAVDVPGDPSALIPPGLAAALGEVERGALEADPAVVSVRTEYEAWRQDVLVFDPEGRLAEDTRASVRIRVRAAARAGDRCEEGIAVVGCPDPADLIRVMSTREIGRRAGRAAAVRLEAGPGPSGEMPVVFANRCGGALFHEALGHALEADLLLRGESPYADRIGEPVASPLITVRDDPTLPGRRGSYRFDDEGTAASSTVLVREGVLQRFLTDRPTALRCGGTPSANGRRPSYREPPLPRMSNLVVDGWKDDPEEILRSTGRGLYVVELGGARVRFPGGDFVFEVAEGYRIEGGRIGRPVDGAILEGRGPEALRRIDRVGSDFLLDPGAGSCDKEGHRVPISLGQPTLRVSRMAVRGTTA
ncbi:MAG: TldD/PmbA family protein [Acidobacteriota bacterium]